MQLEYSTRKLEKQLSNATEIKKAFGTMAKKVQQRLEEMKSSSNLSVLLQIPAAKCHLLTKNRAGQWAVTISGNHRLIFEIAQDPLPMKTNTEIDTLKVTDIRIMESTDYHSRS